MKILLVEDDANLREVTQRSLEKERYVVEIAADYRTALQKMRIMIMTAFCWILCCRMAVAWICWKS